MQLSTQRGRLQNKNTDDDAQKNIISQKNAELQKYVEEIQILSTDNNQMNTELEEITFELEAALVEIEKNGDELTTLRAAVEESDEKTEKLTDERDALRIRVEDLSDRLEKRNSEYEVKISGLEKKVVKLKTKVRIVELDREKQALEIKGYQESLRNTKDDDHSILLKEMKREIVSKDAVIADLKIQLEDSMKDFELLAKDWSRFDTALTKRTASESPKTDHDRTNLKEKISMFSARRKEDTERIRVLVNQVADREASILSLEQTIQQYESGAFGLKEAIYEIKQLKSAVKMVDEKSANLVQQITDLEAQGSDLAEENFILRSKLELPPTDIDVSNFKRLKAVELEKVKSLNFTLQGEIDRLEEERLSLKSQLRLRALEKGEKAIEMGLDAVDLYAVEEYADALRAGDYTGMTAKPVFNNSVLNKLITQLEYTHEEIKELKSKVLTAERKMNDAEKECDLLESAITELSRSMIDSGLVDSNNPENVSHTPINNLTPLGLFISSGSIIDYLAPKKIQIGYP